MLKILKKASWLAMGVAVTLLVAAGSSSAQVKGNTIIFGAAVSFTGKYSTAGSRSPREPMMVIQVLELKQRPPQFLYGGERAHPQEILLQDADEPLQ